MLTQVVKNLVLKLVTMTTAATQLQLKEDLPTQESSYGGQHCLVS